MTAPDDPVDLEFVIERMIKLEAALKRMRRKCRRCREERTPAIGFRLGADATIEQEPDDDDEVERTEVATRSGTTPRARP